MRKFLRYSLRAILVFLIMMGLLIVFMLNPEVVYAKKHAYKQFTVYSKHDCPSGYDRVLENALALVKESELYNPTMKADIFLNDGNGAAVKFVLRKAFGEAMAWGYHNNVILNGTTDASLTWLQMNGYNRHLARTIAHELIHCYEAKKLGWLKARPFGNIAMWKWEGYAEYVSYRSSIKNEKQVLMDAIRKYEEGKDKESFAAAMVDIDEGTSIAGKDYFRFWIMVKYLVDIKQVGFNELIKASIEEKSTYSEMIDWYRTQMIMGG
jgi:hypothetical protein